MGRIKDGQYTLAMKSIITLLTRRQRTTLPEVTEEAQRESLPLEIVLEVLSYLVTMKIVAEVRFPSKPTSYVVKDSRRLRRILRGPHQKQTGLVLTLPAFNRFGVHQTLLAFGTDYVTTESAFRDLLSSAKEEILICSPFAEFEGLNRFLDLFVAKLNAGCTLQILSRQIAGRDPNSRYGQIQEFARALPSSGLLSGSFEVRNYHFSDARRVESNSHAKLVIADGKRAYVGSADFRPNSLDRNFEVGILVKGDAAEGVRRVFVAMFSEAEPVIGGSHAAVGT